MSEWGPMAPAGQFLGNLAVTGPSPHVDAAHPYFGAYRDGTHDDGAAIKAAHEFALASGGARVFLAPDKVWTIKTPFTLYAGVGDAAGALPISLVGVEGATIIQAHADLNGSSTPLITVDGSGTAFSQARASHTFRDLRFRLGTVGGSNVNVPALYFKTLGQKAIVERVDVLATQITNAGILCETVLDIEFRDCLLRTWHGYHPADYAAYPPIGAGIRFLPTAGWMGYPTNTRLINCTCMDFARGIDFAYPSALSNPNVITIDGCRLDNNRVGIYVDRLRVGELSIVRSRFESDHMDADPDPANPFGGIYVLGYSNGEDSNNYAHNITIEDNKFSQFQTSGSVAVLLNRVVGARVKYNSITGEGNAYFLDINDGGHVTGLELDGNERLNSPAVLLTIPGYSGVLGYNDFTQTQRSLDMTVRLPITAIGAGSEISTVVTATASLTAANWGAIAAGATAEQTIAVTGAIQGHTAKVTPASAPESGLLWEGYVSAPDVVTVRLANVTAAPISPGTRTWRAEVIIHV